MASGLVRQIQDASVMAGKSEQNEAGSQEVFRHFSHVKKENKNKKLKRTLT